jgi:D-arabinose 1-dehydrogenase-like Zn-dependent alcohol dehydrogenase
MAKMKAVAAVKAGAPFEVVERDVPDPGPGQVRVKVEACGVCHSDAIARFGGYPGLKWPRIPGHEIAGRIDALGKGVSAFNAGDRVGVGWHGGHCFVCDPCRRGSFINCQQGKVTGISHDGGYAEFAVVPAESLARIPDGIDAVDAGPLLCAGITTYNSLRNSGVRAGDTVAVQGIGGLGHLGVQFAAKMGMRTVALSKGAGKEKLARELGATEYIDTSAVTPAEGLQQLGGADLILATAPNSEAIAAAIGGLKPRGTLLVVAAPQEALTMSVLPLISGKRIQGWPSGSSIDAEDTMRFCALTGIRPRIELFPLERAEEAFGKMMANQVRFRAVLTP